MQKIDATSAEAQSADLMAANIEQLKVLFPELITEGPNGVAVNVDVLKTLVGDKTATDAEEKYGLNWHGKRQARKLALLIRQALFVNLARAEVSKPLDGLKLNGIGTLQ